jgi:flavin-dependent dehydrogenase
MGRARSRAEVVIAGGGPAAAAIAVSLLSSGIRTLLLVSQRQTFRMAEAIPSAALPLIEALGLTGLVRQVGIGVKRMENWSDAENPVIREDSFVLVDRTEFARRMLEAAMLQGAQIETIVRRPAFVQCRDGVAVEVAGCVREFDAAIDATGRAAIWSRPIKRASRMIAYVFEAPPMTRSVGLKLVRSDTEWAYRIGFRTYTTVVIMSPHRESLEFPKYFSDALEISPRNSRLIYRRAAGVQWTACTIRDRVVTIGDAALAHDPLSGQGIRFAFGSALAAAAVIRTWLHSPHDRATPSEFYTNFVNTERRRHLRFIRSFYGSQIDAEDDESVADLAIKPLFSDHSEPSPMLGREIYFSGRVESASLHVDGYIQRGEIIRLRDGGTVRWLGGFDLLRLRELTRPAIVIANLIRSLEQEGLDADRSIAVVNWCVANRILSCYTT